MFDETMKVRPVFITILAISAVVGSVASCKKSSDAQQTIPVTVTRESSVNGIPLEKLLGDFIDPEMGHSFNLTLLSDRTYRLEKVGHLGWDDTRVIAKSSGTWSVEKSLILLTPASTDGNDVFGDFIILDPDISREGQVSLFARLKDDRGLEYINLLRPEAFF